MAKATFYGSDAELETVERFAGDEGTSKSIVVRIALRRLFGMPIPRGWQAIADAAALFLDPSRPR